jgi:hypothetical protein
MGRGWGKVLRAQPGDEESHLEGRAAVNAAKSIIEAALGATGVQLATLEETPQGRQDPGAVTTPGSKLWDPTATRGYRAINTHRRRRSSRRRRRGESSASEYG